MGEDRQLASVASAAPTPPSRPGRIERLRRVLSRVPLVVVALALIVPAMYLRLGWLATFVPGAVRRLNWRHALVMTGLAVVFDLGNNAVRSLTMADTPYPTVVLACNFLMFLVLGTAEGLLIRAWSWRGFGLLTAAGAAGALVLGMADSLLYWSGWLLFLPQIFTYGVQYHLSSLLACPLLLAWAWTTTPAALRRGPVMSRRGWLTVAGGVAATATAFVLFYGLVAYDLAEWGMTGRGPMARCYATLILEYRGQSSDFALIWQQLEAADWRKTARARMLVEPWEAGNEDDEVDWRQWAVQILCRHDSPAAADRFSALLLAHPSPTLAQYAAPVLAENRKYEAVPVLLRFALAMRQEESRVAILRLRVPQAVLCTLREAADQAELHNRREPGTRDFELRKEEHRQLVDLFGRDLGPNWRDWAYSYDESISDVPSPLPPEVREETDRVVDCYGLYVQAVRRQEDFLNPLASKLASEDGREKDFEKVRAWFQENFPQGLPPGPLAGGIVPPEIEDACQTVSQYRERAARILTVDEPDWCAPTTLALAKETMAFAERVDAVIRKHFPEERPSGPQQKT